MLKFRDMIYHQTPQKLRSHIIIGMNNTIACCNNGTGILQNYCRIVFHQLIDGFAHYLYISFHCSLAKNVILKLDKQSFAWEESLHFFTSI